MYLLLIVQIIHILLFWWKLDTPIDTYYRYNIETLIYQDTFYQAIQTVVCSSRTGAYSA